MKHPEYKEMKKKGQGSKLCECGFEIVDIKKNTGLCPICYYQAKYLVVEGTLRKIQKHIKHEPTRKMIDSVFGCIEKFSSEVVKK